MFQPNDYYTTNNKIAFDLRQIIPKNHDIIGIHMNFTDNIKTIKIKTVNGSITFDKDMKEYMETFHFYLTLCKYINVDLVVEYDKDYIESLIEYEMVDEYIDIEEYGDEVTIFDGYDYHQGKIVKTKTVPTGNQIKNIKRGAFITLPELIFSTQEIEHKNTDLTYKIKHKIKLQGCDNEYIKKLETQHNLQKINDKWGYVDSYIYYTANIIGFKYHF